MSHNKITRKWIRPGGPQTANPGMTGQLGGQTLSKTPNAAIKNNLYIGYMNKSNLSKLTKDQLIALLLEKQRPIPLPRVKKVIPIPKPRKSVKQMVQNYETNIITPPRQFMEKPIPIPRRPIPMPRKKKVTPIPRQRTQITQLRSAFHKYTNSYEVGIKNETDPLIQMSSTRLAIAHFMKQLLPQMKGIKFIETLKIYFEQQKGQTKLSPELDILIVNQKQ